jgi:RNA polymerase sigma-70 factor (ECF subfamily)
VAQIPATWPLALLMTKPSAEAPCAVPVRARERDKETFPALFDRYVGNVYGFLRDLLGDDTAADEGTQEVFFRAYDRLSSLREQDRVLPWLLGIARNVSLEQYRARRRNVVVALPEEPGPDALDADACAHLDEALHALSPESLLLGRETEVLVARALQALPEERRAALLLRVDHGLSYDEIAQLMGWSLAKVKVELHRARGALRARLAELHGGTP